MEWQPIETAPKNGTRFIGAIYWPTPSTYRRFSDSVLKAPAEGVKYNYIASTFWHDGAWHVAPLDELVDQDSLYAWKPLDLPPIPEAT